MLRKSVFDTVLSRAVAAKPNLSLIITKIYTGNDLCSSNQGFKTCHRQESKLLQILFPDTRKWQALGQDLSGETLFWNILLPTHTSEKVAITEYSQKAKCVKLPLKNSFPIKWMSSWMGPVFHLKMSFTPNQMMLWNCANFDQRGDERILTMMRCSALAVLE